MNPAFTGPVRHVYVHVPFCRERCDYCDFASGAIGPPVGRGGDTVRRRAAGRYEQPGASVSKRDELLDAYVAAVVAEWERERVAHEVRRLVTLYVGGGTPSLLGPGRLERLLAAFRPYLTPKAEVTVETCSPGSGCRTAMSAGKG